MQSPDPLSLANGAGRAAPEVGLLPHATGHAAPGHLLGPRVRRHGYRDAEGVGQVLGAGVVYGGPTTHHHVQPALPSAVVHGCFHFLEIFGLILVYCLLI